MDDKEKLNQQLQGVIFTIRKFINRVNGDDYTVGLTKEIKDLLVSIDKNEYSKEINNEHFDKLIKVSMEVCEKMEKATEYMSNLNVRYTSDTSNNKLLDKMLDEFKMEKVNLTVQLPKGADIVQPKAELPTDVKETNK
jgi:hypothetical protein